MAWNGERVCPGRSDRRINAIGRRTARGGGSPRNPPAAGRGSGEHQSPELQQARETLQRDIAEGKRLQEQLKLDRKAGDRDAVKRDTDALKANREKVKMDQERIKQLLAGRGGARSGGGRSGGGRGRGGA